MLDPTARLNAALSGRYRIERELGAGGMATVYLAQDLRHDRKVALKVLKPELAAVIGAERFLAEIKTTANLQHPHILPLFDSGNADSFLFYVMPYVEGETVKEKLDREHQLPVDDAVRIAGNVADALDYAHRHGVIHRDIKPANILLQDGKPVIADFGIALAVGAAGGGRLTETGLSLGTPHYMSPEQATGEQSVGPGTDIYALGCVLYEMLVGAPPYTAANAQAVLGKILAGAPVAPRAERASIPPHVDAAIRRALEKLPADRFAHAADLARALGDPGFRHGELIASGTAPAQGWWNRLSVALAASTLVLGLALGWSLIRPEPAASAPARVSLVLPADRPVAFGWQPGGSLAISPNGTDIVYASADPDLPVMIGNGRRQSLVVRTMASRAVRDLPGTAGAFQPFFSPDGRWVAFFTATGELKKVSLDGGNPLTLADGIDSSQFAFGTWMDEGEIVFSTTDSLGLRRVSADGGSPEKVTTVESAKGEVWHGYPESVPGIRTVLFAVIVQDQNDHIEAVNLDTGERRVVAPGTEPRYLVGGHLLFRRGGELLAAPFDLRRLALTGPAVPVADEIRTSGPDPGRDGITLQLAVSRAGTLAYVPPATGGTSTLGLVNREGAFEALGPPVRTPSPKPRVSPDGRTVAVLDGPLGGLQAYLHDITRGSTDRLTQGRNTTGLAWRPNGRELALASEGGTEHGIFLTDLSGAERLLVPSKGTVLNRTVSWSPDGEILAFSVQDGTQSDIWIVSPDDAASARPLINGPASEYSPVFSPDGRWLAYVSDESGQTEVYVRRYPQGERLRVSTGGGNGPVWSPNGRELFFQGPYEGTQRLMVVSVAPAGETLRLGAPTTLLDMRVRGPDGRYVAYAASGNVGVSYDIFPDGRRFVMARTPETPALEIILVQNFVAELERLAPK